MGVKVLDLKGDGAAWLVIHRKGKRKTKRIGDWAEARRLAREIEYAHSRLDAGLTEPRPLRDVLEAHRTGYVSRLKHSTAGLQSGQIKNHLIPEFGDVDAHDLSEAHVAAFVEKKLRTHSPSFIRGCVNVLRKAMRRLHRASPEVPELRVDLRELFTHIGSAQAKEIRSVDSWTSEEAAELLAIVRRCEPRYYPLILTLLHTGIRRGEVLGLRWSDVDFERGRILIRRARVNSRTVLPKHRKQNDPPRQVIITGPMSDVLRGLATFRYRRSGGWVFASSKGTAIQETTLHRAWSRIKIRLAAKGVRALTLHSLRHTFATLSLESGRSVKWVAEQLGHRDASVTLNVYAHALPVAETDLSYLPIPGDVTKRHQDGTNAIRSSNETS
ncbi:MAG: site-specific integrase [Myxococcales bacterium]|nr:site-specific integrase [Myxococcales bacterium]